MHVTSYYCAVWACNACQLLLLLQACDCQQVTTSPAQPARADATSACRAGLQRAHRLRQHTADVGAGTPVHNDVEVHAGAAGVLADKALGVGLVHCPLQGHPLVVVLAPAQCSAAQTGSAATQIARALAAGPDQIQRCLVLDWYIVCVGR